MIEITSLEECLFPSSDTIVLALGFFDGVHLAHQRLIETCKSRAAQRKGKSVLFTFQNHPSSYLTPDSPTPLLTPYPLKKQLLASLGIDVLIGVPFDRTLCHTSANDFIATYLCQHMHVDEIIVGFNFHFGHNRQGSADLLKQQVPELFEKVTIVDQQFHGDVPISSSYIRNLILHRKLDDAADLLTRPYTIAGTVIQGKGRGRTLGIPTANLDMNRQLLPANGVYGVRVRLTHLAAQSYLGVMNIGTVPTFSDPSQKTVEIHILDFEDDIYDEYLIVEIVEHLRDEKRFSGPDELVQQIKADIAQFRSRQD